MNLNTSARGLEVVTMLYSCPSGLGSNGNSGANIRSYWTDEGVPGAAKRGRRRPVLSAAVVTGAYRSRRGPLRDFKHYEMIQQ